MTGFSSGIDDPFLRAGTPRRPRRAELVDEEHVPFLPVYRYKPAGLRKRADWEDVWKLQRQEDAIAAELGKDVTDPAVRMAVKEKLGDIPVPPKYGSGDFLRTSYWRHRGKLDV
ncbi:MAG TPA: hypothetical protein VM306_23390, partial [Lentzea sp.]|nr:hypothetical protein [Lentzea sp.]